MTSLPFSRLSLSIFMVTLFLLLLVSPALAAQTDIQDTAWFAVVERMIVVAGAALLISAYGAWKTRRDAKKARNAQQQKANSQQSPSP